MPNLRKDALANIRSKYPQYQDMDDATLSNKVLAAHPEYSDLVDNSSVSAPPATQRGFLGSLADSSGLSGLASAAAAFPSALSHSFDPGRNPLTDLKNAAVSKMDQVRNIHSRADAVAAIPVIGPALKTAQSQYDAGNGSGAAGTLAGTVLGAVAPMAAERSIPLVGRGLSAAGDASQEAGIGLMNKTIGTLKNDFKRGANPARGYFATGNGPALSMNSLATKAAEAHDAVGANIGKFISATPATPIATSDVSAALSKPIMKARALEMGPGGLGNTNTIDAYANNFQPTMQTAFSNANGMTPQEVFDLKRGIAQNTNWSDPTQFNLKAVRQQQVGKLSGVLQDAIPELAPLNSNYADLGKFAARAQHRAETHSVPLSGFLTKGGLTSAGATVGALNSGEHGAILGGIAGLAADSVPVKTTLASGMYYGGDAASSIGGMLQSLPPSALSPVAVSPYNLIAKKKRDQND